MIMDADEGAQEEGVESSYEDIRIANIQRNESFLKELGLTPNRQQQLSNLKTSSSRSKSKEATHHHNYQENSIPTRRSLRVSQLDPINYKEASDFRLTSSISRNSENNFTNVPFNDDDLIDVKRQRLATAPLESTSISLPSTTKRKAEKSTSSSTGITPGSCRELNADFLSFFESDRLGQPIAFFGKAAVMSLANNNNLPKFSKYSGVVEWNNCVFLWVNIFAEDSRNKGQYPNTFEEKGRFIKWFGGSTMTADSRVIQRMMLSTSHNAVDSIDNNNNNNNNNISMDTVVLFIRLEGEPYACFGPLRCKSFNLDHSPVIFLWELLFYEQLKDIPHFQRIVNIS